MRQGIAKGIRLRKREEREEGRNEGEGSAERGLGEKGWE